VSYFFAIRAIDFSKKVPYTDAMLRLLIAGVVVFLAIGLTLVAYNVFILGTGLAGAGALLHRYWRDATAGTSRSTQWMAIIVAAVMLGWAAGHMRESGRY
jgi:hypothetical protein